MVAQFEHRLADGILTCLAAPRSDFDTSRLMEEDLSKFGSERKATLAKWDEVTGGKEVVSSN